MVYFLLISAGMMMGGLLTAGITLSNVTDADTSPKVDHEELTVRFQQAGEKIEDPEIQAYYEMLMESVDPYLANPDETGAKGYLPDIEGITYESLTTPFQQAGLQIEDPELKAVYDRLVGKIGLDK